MFDAGLIIALSILAIFAIYVVNKLSMMQAGAGRRHHADRRYNQRAGNVGPVNSWYQRLNYQQPNYQQYAATALNTNNPWTVNPWAVYDQPAYLQYDMDYDSGAYPAIYGGGYGNSYHNYPNHINQQPINYPGNFPMYHHGPGFIPGVTHTRIMGTYPTPSHRR